MPQKTIVVSDIHMSNGEPYSWFKGPYPGFMEKMFTHIAADEAVKELVLLGDVFDTWLYPVDTVPLTAAQIIDKWKNPVLTALDQCVAKVPNTYYINGNHDMGVTQSDLNRIACGKKTIQRLSSDQYNGMYPKQRHLEHGNAVDMFNAPDDSQDTIGGYPLGYFITRLVCTANDQSTARSALFEAILNAQSSHPAMAHPSTSDEDKCSIGKLLVEAMIDVLAIHAEVTDDTRIRFSEPQLDNQKITVGMVKERYHTLLGRWFWKHPVHLLETMLVGLSPDGLDWYAKKLVADGVSPLVVVGHTHHGEQKTYKHPQGVYGNSGCWCNTDVDSSADAHAPSYIEIIGSTATLYEWNPDDETFVAQQ